MTRSLSLDFTNVTRWPGGEEGGGGGPPLFPHVACAGGGGGGGGGGGALPSPLCGLYGDMPLDRVWFSLAVSYTGYIVSSESVSLHDLFTE